MAIGGTGIAGTMATAAGFAYGGVDVAAAVIQRCGMSINNYTQAARTTRSGPHVCCPFEPDPISVHTLAAGHGRGWRRLVEKLQQ
jgi:hypothetical protein